VAYTRHPHVATRCAPPRTADHHPQHNAMARFNTRLAIVVTKVVGSMWCAYVFAVFDLISLPDAIRGGPATIVSWIAQTFLQLVLLSVIMVGQNVQAAASDDRAMHTYLDAEATLHDCEQLQAHLADQDAHLVEQDKTLGELIARVEAALATGPWLAAATPASVEAEAGPEPARTVVPLKVRD
jgi:hypothetical protein